MRMNRICYLMGILLSILLCLGITFTGVTFAEKSPEILVFKESVSDVEALFYSPDGRSIMSGANGILTVWDLTTGAVERSIVGNRDWAVYRLVDRMKRYKAPPRFDNRGGRIEPFGGEEYYEFPIKAYRRHQIQWFPQDYEAYIKTLFSPDGRYALRGYFVLHDNAAEEPVRFQQYGKDFLENIFKQNRGRVWFWYPGFHWRVPRDSQEGPQRILRSPDGKYSLHGTFELMDLTTGKNVRNFTHVGCPGQSLFSPDGRYVLFTNENSNKTRYRMQRNEINGFFPFLLDIENGKEKRFEGQGHANPIESIAFSPDAGHIVTGSRDYTIKLWDVKTGKEIRTFEGHSESVTMLAFSPDGQHFVSGSDDNTLRLWDLDSEQEFSIFEPKKRYDGSFNTVLFSPDGRYVVSSNNRYEMTLWDVTERRETASVNTEKGIRSIAFSLDGRQVITAHENGYLRLWGTESLKLIATMSAFDDGEWVVFTPEGYFNASPKGDRHLKIRAGRSVYSIDKFYDRFYNPALVARKLSGKRVALAHDIREGVASPPTVRIVTPTKGETFNNDEIKVVVKAVDRGGGIAEVRLYQNGSALGKAGRGFAIKKAANEIHETYPTALVPGINRFKAVGFSKDRTESGSHEIIVEYAGGREEIDLYLVVMGINEYRNPSLKLNFAVADAKGLRDFFEKKWKNLFNNLHLIEIYDRDATKENIRRILTDMESEEQDVVLIFLAGHGLNIRDEWYFLTHDVVYPEREDHVMERAISSTEMKEMIMNNRSLKKALFIDACKSGRMLLALSRGVEDRRAIAQLARSTGTHVVAASTEDQLASELSQLGHGVFTYTLLQGLNGDASDRDKTVTVRELIAFIEQKLPGISEIYRQKPQYPVIDSRGQDFPLVINR